MRVLTCVISLVFRSTVAAPAFTDAEQDLRQPDARDRQACSPIEWCTEARAHAATQRQIRVLDPVFALPLLPPENNRDAADVSRAMDVRLALQAKVKELVASILPHGFRGIASSPIDQRQRATGGHHAAQRLPAHARALSCTASTRDASAARHLRFSANR